MYDLGLPINWLDGPITPRQFHELMERLRDREERERYGAGLITSMIYNCNRAKDAPFKLPSDFVPSRHQLAPAPHVVNGAGLCTECGLHESIGHTAECSRGQSLLQYNLAQMTLFVKQFPAHAPGETWTEPRNNGG